MSSIDSRLLVDISKREEKHLICSICLNIFHNVVTTDCGHSFCKKCLKQLIESNRKQCPECRQQFKNKRTNETANQNNLVIKSGYVFTRNLVVNSMVNELMVKCKYHLNGCEETMELSSLKNHLEGCVHRICRICDLTIDEEVGDHNCLYRLKKENKRLDFELNDFKEDTKQIASELFDSNKFKVDYIMFGTLLTDPQTIELGSSEGNLLMLTSSLHFWSEEIDLIMFCLELSLPFVVIQLKSINDFQEVLNLKDRSIGWFDVDSEDPSERYIVIKLMPHSVNHLIKLMRFWSHINYDDIKFETIDGNKTQEFVNNSRKLIPN